MLGCGLRAIDLLLHVVNLEGENTQTVNSPCRTFGIDASIRQNFHLRILLTEVGVDLLYEVGTVLVALVDATFQGESFHWVDLWITYDVLEMPLNGVDPTFQLETVLDCTFVKRIIDRCINVISHMIVIDRLIENLVGFLCKCHITFIIS